MEGRVAAVIELTEDHLPVEPCMGSQLRPPGPVEAVRALPVAEVLPAQAGHAEWVVMLDDRIVDERQPTPGATPPVTEITILGRSERAVKPTELVERGGRNRHVVRREEARVARVRVVVGVGRIDDRLAELRRARRCDVHRQPAEDATRVGLEAVAQRGEPPGSVCSRRR